ncbi:hypothetical protein [Nonomuraea sediminis]|uniref:hypothetical protein n=1 Tax=Nonomuraea sediminis TaxID=2835864 RepID=UPI001BDCFCDE|nr:hypothetical protein [Nonomuraea sediminis]
MGEGAAAGLGGAGIGLVAAVWPLATAFPHGAHTLSHRLLGGEWQAGMSVALLWSVGLVAWLLATTARTIVGTLAERRRQRLLVDLTADYSPAHDAYVLPSAVPVAYCMPGREARVVLSRGAVDLR